VRKRPLGKTGLMASELALGTWGLSGDAYGKVDEAEAEATVKRALDVGVTTFDTADAYGAGKMEALLGRVLPKNDDIVLVTKVGIDRTTDPPQRRFDAAHIEKAAAASRKRTKREALDVLLLHNPAPDTLHEGDAVPTLVAMKEKGLIRHWGVSVGDIDVARVAMEKGAEVLEIAYNLFHALDLHRLAGDIMVGQVGVLARSVLSHGLLHGMWSKARSFEAGDHRKERWTAPELEIRVGQLDAIRYLVKGDVRTMRAAAVRFVLANHLVSAAVLGPKSAPQLEALVRETGSGPTYLSDSDLSALPRALSRVGITT
jgi:aryl-alcohol dehydrogenase-like predicted oxidoreductase